MGNVGRGREMEKGDETDGDAEWARVDGEGGEREI